MKYLYIFLSAIFLLSSCNKDSITIDKKVDISPPEVIDGAAIKGYIVSTSGEKLEGVNVDVYQNDKKLGRVYSDNKGYYNTQSIAINPDYLVTIKYNKDEFETKYRRFDFEEALKITKDLILGKENTDDDVQRNEFDLINPTDTNLVKLYGYARLADGTPVSGVGCQAVWKYWLSNGTYKVLWIQKYISDYTDANGYFEVLVPKGEIIHFEAYKTRYPGQLLASCRVSFSDENPTGELSKWHFMELGSFDEDSEISLRDDIEFETLRTHISGYALRCDGTPIVNGTLRASITLGKLFYYYKGNIEDYPFGSNGEFSIDIETCPTESDFDLFINIDIEDTDIKFSGEKYIEFAENVDIGQVDLCFDENDYPDEFELTIESVTRNYPTGGDNPRSGEDKLRTGFHYVEGDFYEDVYLATDIIQLGEVPITYFKMWKGKKEGDIVHIYETTFEAKPEDVTMTITKIEGHYVYGNIVGDVDTPRGRQPVNATFKIYNK